MAVEKWTSAADRPPEKIVYRWPISTGRMADVVEDHGAVFDYDVSYDNPTHCVCGEKFDGEGEQRKEQWAMHVAQEIRKAGGGG